MYYMAGVVDEGTVMLGGGGVAGSSCLEAAACCSFQALCDAGDPKPSSDLVEQSKQPRAKDEALSDTETVARQAASGDATHDELASIVCLALNCRLGDQPIVSCLADSQEREAAEGSWVLSISIRSTHKRW